MTKGRNVPPATIKAIETIYPWPNGPRYRSRLEARWAVLFDGLGIRHKYEDQGYTFAGVKYLPDFYLPDYGVYVEVKGVDDPNYAVLRTPALFAAHMQVPVLMCFGEMRPNHMMLALASTGPQSIDVEQQTLGVRPAWWLVCPLCGSLGLAQAIPRGDATMGQSWQEMLENCDMMLGHIPVPTCRGSGLKIKTHRLEPAGQQRIADAYAAGRQARFEHGEHGR